MCRASLHQSQINTPDLTCEMFPQKCAQITGDPSHIYGRILPLVDRRILKKVLSRCSFHPFRNHCKALPFPGNNLPDITDKPLRVKGSLRNVDQVRRRSGLSRCQRSCRKKACVAPHDFDRHDQVGLIGPHVADQFRDGNDDMPCGGRKPRRVIDSGHIVVHRLRDHQNGTVHSVRIQSALQTQRRGGRTISPVDQNMPYLITADRLFHTPVIFIAAKFVPGRPKRHRRCLPKAEKFLLLSAYLQKVSPDNAQDPMPCHVQFCPLRETLFTLSNHAVCRSVDHRSRSSGLEI